jgi:hypothetical protein
LARTPPSRTTCPCTYPTLAPATNFDLGGYLSAPSYASWDLTASGASDDLVGYHLRGVMWTAVREVPQVPAGMVHGKILYSDGVGAPQTYLEPTEPDAHYGRPIYANSHVAFFKGIGLQDVGKYSSVELWVSPYSENPSQLKPTKLADFPFQGMPGEPRGGWGFAAMGGPTQDEPVWLWNLPNATQRTYGLGGYPLDAFPGISHEHLWVTASKTGGPTQLIRLAHE